MGIYISMITLIVQIICIYDYLFKAQTESEKIHSLIWMGIFLFCSLHFSEVSW